MATLQKGPYSLSPLHIHYISKKVAGFQRIVDRLFEWFQGEYNPKNIMISEIIFIYFSTKVKYF